MGAQKRLEYHFYRISSQPVAHKVIYNGVPSKKFCPNLPHTRLLELIVNNLARFRGVLFFIKIVGLITPGKSVPTFQHQARDDAQQRFDSIISQMAAHRQLSLTHHALSSRTQTINSLRTLLRRRHLWLRLPAINNQETPCPRMQSLVSMHRSNATTRHIPLTQPLGCASKMRRAAACKLKHNSIIQ